MIEKLPQCSEKVFLESYVMATVMSIRDRNMIAKKFQPYEAQARSVLNSFNEITGKNAEPVPLNLEQIARCLSMGATVEDCQLVIEDRFMDWKDNHDMRPYIRIKTIFAPSNFQDYKERARDKNSLASNLKKDKAYQERIAKLEQLMSMK
jgi:uncharacterized phage protein (TIGR02220 family)